MDSTMDPVRGRGQGPAQGLPGGLRTVGLLAEAQTWDLEPRTLGNNYRKSNRYRTTSFPQTFVVTKCGMSVVSIGPLDTSLSKALFLSPFYREGNKCQKS